MSQAQEHPCCWVGFDTSNYTTSVAVVTLEGAEPRIIANLKAPLPVPPGGRGLRQSDAVFAHAKHLPDMADQLGHILKESGVRVAAVGYSARPRDAVDSYMPCFLQGAVAARSFAAGCGVPVYSFSHQSGHIMAALCGAGHLVHQVHGLLPERPWLAFHVSGGTTEAVVATPRTNVRIKQDTHDEYAEMTDHGQHMEGTCDGCTEDMYDTYGLDGGFSVRVVGGGADLHAGQVIDRVGVLMGLDFPAGPALEALACTYHKKLPPMRLSVEQGVCHLSGLENQAAKLWQETGDASLVAAYVLTFIGRTLRRMTDQIQQTLATQGAELPVLYAGGVMSNYWIRPLLTQGTSWSVSFAPPVLAADNAVGVALLCADRYLRSLEMPHCL